MVIALDIQCHQKSRPQIRDLWDPKLGGLEAGLGQMVLLDCESAPNHEL